MNKNKATKLTTAGLLAENAVLRAKQSELKVSNSKLLYKMEADKKAFVATLATLRFLQNECIADLSDIENHEVPNDNHIL